MCTSINKKKGLEYRTRRILMHKGKEIRKFYLPSNSHYSESVRTPASIFIFSSFEPIETIKIHKFEKKIKYKLLVGIILFEKISFNDFDCSLKKKKKN